MSEKSLLQARTNYQICARDSNADITAQDRDDHHKSVGTGMDQTPRRVKMKCEQLLLPKHKDNNLALYFIGIILPEFHIHVYFTSHWDHGKSHQQR